MAADEPVKRLAVPRAQDLAELSIHDPRARRRLLVWPNQVPLTSSGAKYRQVEHDSAQEAQSIASLPQHSCSTTPESQRTLDKNATTSSSMEHHIEFAFAVIKDADPSSKLWLG